MGQRTADAAFRQRLAQVNELLATVSMLVQDRETETTQPDWADVGDLAEVVTQLEAACAQLGGE